MSTNLLSKATPLEELTKSMLPGFIWKSDTANESNTFRGFIYFLVESIDGDINLRLKPGKAEGDLWKVLGGYKSRYSRYHLSLAIEYGAKSKEQLRELLFKKEATLKEKFQENNIPLIFGSEHWKVNIAEHLEEITSIIRGMIATRNLYEPYKTVKGKVYMLPKGEHIYKPQKQAAKKVWSLIRANHPIIFLDSENLTQLGKTGFMNELSIFSQINPIDGTIPCTSIVSGMSDNDWLNQTVARLPVVVNKSQMWDINTDSVVKLVAHSKSMQKHLKYIPDTINIIQVDESFIGTGEGSLLIKHLQREFDIDLGLLETNPDLLIEQMKEKRIVLVLVCATDFYSRFQKQINDQYIRLVQFKPGPGYVGPQDLMNRGQIKDWISLINKNKKTLSDELKDLVSRKLNDKKFILVRAGPQDDLVKSLLKNEYSNKINVLSYNHHSRNSFHGSFLSIKPEKLTIVLIKNYWKAAKTLDKTHITAVVERKVNRPIVANIVQGLLGRICGYQVVSDIEIYVPLEVVQQVLKNKYNSGQKLDTRTKAEVSSRAKRKYTLQPLVVPMPKNKRLISNIAIRDHLKKIYENHKELKNYKFRHISENTGFHREANKHWSVNVDPDFKKLSKKGANLSKLKSTQTNLKTVQGAQTSAYFYNTENHIKILVSMFNGYYNKETTLKGKKGYGG